MWILAHGRINVGAPGWFPDRISLVPNEPVTARNTAREWVCAISWIPKATVIPAERGRDANRTTGIGSDRHHGSVPRQEELRSTAPGAAWCSRLEVSRKKLSPPPVRACRPSSYRPAIARTTRISRKAPAASCASCGLNGSRMSSRRLSIPSPSRLPPWPM